jgi:LysR family transcriptional regulator, glycine cleavage system transcriptional activator
MDQRGLPPLNWLRAFEAAAKTLSFTEAARDLGLTQAAVSKHVKALELNLRHPLFHRHARSLELTKSGAAYLPKVRDALDRLAVGTREVFGRRQGEALTVRCAVSFCVNWLAPRLPEFFALYPGKDIRILSSVWSDRFDPDAYDLDIQYGKGPWKGLKNHRLTREKITPLCSPAMAQKLRKPDDLRHERLLHVIGYREGWGVWLRAASASSIDAGNGLQLDTTLAAYELASQSVGVALGRSSLMQKDLESGRLVRPFDLEVDIEEAFYLLDPEPSNPHPDAAVFADWLISVAAA